MTTPEMTTTEDWNQLPPAAFHGGPNLGFIRVKRLGAFGAGIILIMIFMAVFADVVSPHDPLRSNYAKFLEART